MNPATVAVGQSLTSGFLAAVVSLLGKVAFSTTDIPIIGQVSLVLLMIVANTLMWTIFSRALDSSRTSVEVFVINTACNFISSALFGWVFFNEKVVFNSSWLIGFACILLGIYIVLSSHSNIQGLNNQDTKKDK